MLPMKIHVPMLTGVAGGMLVKPPKITGMLINFNHSALGNNLLKLHTIIGIISPTRNIHNKFLYGPSGPNKRFRPTSPHMNDASKATLSFGHVQGLLGDRESTSQLFSIPVNIHHVMERLIVPAIVVPTSYVHPQVSPWTQI